PGRDPADYQAVLKVADRIDGHPSVGAPIPTQIGPQQPLADLTTANTIKRDLQTSAADKFGVPTGSAETAGEKYASSAMRRAIETQAAEVGPLNAQQSQLIDTARALARATARDANTNKLYGARALAAAAVGGGEYARSRDPYSATAMALASQLALDPAVAT